jgi:ATP-dependent DNA helicase RecQ
MRSPRVFVHGFDRPNLWLGVETAASEERKRSLLIDRVRKTERPGIIYSATRRHAEEIQAELVQIGIPSAFYHGRLSKSDRERMQEQFMRDEVEVMVATSAFGMGVDKPNVRFVFHYEAPDSLDSYYQEIGRGGRDGQPATVVLLYRRGDLNLQKFFKGAGRIDERVVERVLKTLRQAGQMNAEELRRTTALTKIKLSRVLERLREADALSMDKTGNVSLLSDPEDFPRLATQATREHAQHRQAEMERIERMRTYAESLSCRRANLLRYFGEETPDECGNCDYCQGAGTERVRILAEKQAALSEQAGRESEMAS